MIVLVTGGSGLVGSALKSIQHKYQHDFIFSNSEECDLTNYRSTLEFISNKSPDCVIHLAANVGGLYKNMNNRVAMFEKNIMINLNVLRVCHELQVAKVVSILSTCIFPDNTVYPINEKMLHDGPPHTSNDAYAYAKRMLELHSRIYNQEHGDNFVCVIPTNIYGENDNFSLTDGHVIPALVHRCYLAKLNKQPFVVKGSGKPLRQFIYSQDLAHLIIYVVDDYNHVEPIILSPNQEHQVSISYIAEQIAKEFDYYNMIEFDTSYADGQYIKTADNSKLVELYGEYDFTSIHIGIKKTVKWFIENYHICRK
uniref:NAD dependent epimerase/dehydratase family protein n=1 Tax=Megaviridae environmental sample TaxID=1737588 RepID=A0A5J6VJ01_9VIRU|nr:MAG: NAD dependent epimerase/dehydratase family protein [Megaviridae environmental sample]